MSTATAVRPVGARRSSHAQTLSMSSLSSDMILDILISSGSFQGLQKLLHGTDHNTKVMQVFLRYKTEIYCAIADRQFSPISGALEAAGLRSLLPPAHGIDPYDDPNLPMELLSEREGNSKTLEIQSAGPDNLEDRVQMLLGNEHTVVELEKLFEIRFGNAFKLSATEKASFRTSLYRIWSFCNGVPRFGSRCVFDPEQIKRGYWETRFLWRYSAADIFEMGKVYAFLVGLVLECCRRCQHQDMFEEQRTQDEEYLSDVIGYHLSKGPKAVLDLYRKSINESSSAKIFKRLAWGAVGYQRFLIGDLEYVWHTKYGSESLQQIAHKGADGAAICS